jgi:hypothetical protein
MRQKSITNWADHHNTYIKEWWTELRCAEEHRNEPCPRFDGAAFDRYLAWFKENTHWEINAPTYTPEETVDLPNPSFDEIANLKFNKLIRNGRRDFELAPVLQFVVS